MQPEPMCATEARWAETSSSIKRSPSAGPVVTPTELSASSLPGCGSPAATFPTLRSQHVAYLAALGHDDEARTALGSVSDWEHRLAERDARRMLRDLAEVAARLDNAELAEWLLPHTLPYDGTVLTSYDLNTCDGAAAVSIAHCETALNRLDEAEAHYKAGIALETSIRAWGLIPNSQIFYAWMLQTRSSPDDTDRAAELLTQAATTPPVSEWPTSPKKHAHYSTADQRPHHLLTKSAQNRPRAGDRGTTSLVVQCASPGAKEGVEGTYWIHERRRLA